MLGLTIVCGVDDSTRATGAVTFGRILSESLEWRLVLVHVIAVPVVPGASGIPGAHDELRDAALADGNALLDSIVESHNLARTVERRVEFGAPIESLVSVCAEEDADLLVVGSHGRGRIASALVGSVSVGVLGRAPCPVAIVPEHASVSRRALDRLERRSPRPVATLALAARRRT